MPDFIPRNDNDLLVFAQNFQTKTKITPEAFGLTAAKNSELNALAGVYQTALDQLSTAQLAAQAATQAKETARLALEESLRAQARIVQAAPETTNEQRALLGLSPRDTTRTATSVPTSTPVLTVDTSQRLRHTLHFADNNAAAGSRRKPEGVRGCEIWVKIGDTPPADLNECRYLATDTATPYVAQFEGADAGKTAHYLARWVNTRNEAGPISATASATITA